MYLLSDGTCVNSNEHLSTGYAPLFHTDPDTLEQLGLLPKESYIFLKIKAKAAWSSFRSSTLGRTIFRGEFVYTKSQLAKDSGNMSRVTLDKILRKLEHFGLLTIRSIRNVGTTFRVLAYDTPLQAVFGEPTQTSEPNTLVPITAETSTSECTGSVHNQSEKGLICTQGVHEKTNPTKIKEKDILPSTDISLGNTQNSTLTADNASLCVCATPTPDNVSILQNTNDTTPKEKVSVKKTKKASYLENVSLPSNHEDCFNTLYNAFSVKKEYRACKVIYANLLNEGLLPEPEFLLKAHNYCIDEGLLTKSDTLRFFLIYHRWEDYQYYLDTQRQNEITQQKKVEDELRPKNFVEDILPHIQNRLAGWWKWYDDRYKNYGEATLYRLQAYEDYHLNIDSLAIAWLGDQPEQLRTQIRANFRRMDTKDLRDELFYLIRQQYILLEKERFTTISSLVNDVPATFIPKEEIGRHIPFLIHAIERLPERWGGAKTFHQFAMLIVGNQLQGCDSPEMQYAMQIWHKLHYFLGREEQITLETARQTNRKHLIGNGDCVVSLLNLLLRDFYKTITYWYSRSNEYADCVNGVTPPNRNYKITPASHPTNNEPTPKPTPAALTTTVVEVPTVPTVDAQKNACAWLERNWSHVYAILQKQQQTRKTWDEYNLLLKAFPDLKYYDQQRLFAWYNTMTNLMEISFEEIVDKLVTGVGALPNSTRDFLTLFPEKAEQLVNFTQEQEKKASTKARYLAEVRGTI